MKAIKYLALCFAAMLATNAMAQKVSADAVSIPSGGEATLVINLETTQLAINTQLTVVLPAGIEIPYDATEEECGVEAGSILYNKPSIEVAKDGNEYQFLIYKNAKSAVYKSTKGSLLSITLKAGAISAGELQGTIKGIVINNEAREEMSGFTDSTFTITVTDPSGIDAITVDDIENAKVYTVGGQRVDGKTAKKGVYVVNGKKMIIK